ncbi:STAS domain-containing protein, partial [Yinghuangia sp. YIM S10712]|uniref:STAS domain-containing protein n=1 Tax=Yinghuangia sp. YIM S10712 TaxID=3436930 RepID=UPI003F536202
MNPLRISTYRFGTWDIVEVAGELDIDSRDELREALDDVIRNGAPARVVVVDFSRLEFCDATGLGVLVAARKAAERRLAELRLVCRGTIRRLVRITELDRSIPVFHTVADAVGISAEPPGAGPSVHGDGMSQTPDEETEAPAPL